MGWVRREALALLELTFYHAQMLGDAQKRAASYARSSTNTEDDRVTTRSLPADCAEGFEGRRPIVERWVRRISVRTLGIKPHEVAFVRVPYSNDTERTYRFARGDGAAL
jgi:hypothetical protein